MRFKQTKSKAFQTSESMELALVLALSGGLMDAYSYLARGQVFANAQTGNLLLLGVHLSTGNIDVVARYLSPVLAFTLGCMLAEIVRRTNRRRAIKKRPIHWRQHVVMGEIVLLTIVSCLSTNVNLLANSLLSLACGMQVQAFRKLHGHAFATTMCIGNLRSGTQEFVAYLDDRRRDHVRVGGLYFFVVISFVVGAVLGNALLPHLGLRTILVSCALLAISWLLMHRDRFLQQGKQNKA